MTEPPPPHATPLAVRPGLSRIVAPNPSPMTYHGTNSWLVDWAEGTTVIDPGSADPTHLAAIVAACRGRLTHILVTHTHHDHTDGAVPLSQQTGAPIVGWRQSADPAFCADIGVEDGEAVGGLRALYTPGHAMDHVCFLTDDGIIFSGDHVMGWSTSVVPPPPDGDLALFLDNLRLVQRRGDRLMLSAHGPAISHPAEHVQTLIDHRLAREQSIMTLLGREPQTLEKLLGRAYAGLNPRLLLAARLNLLSHLVKLERDGVAEKTHDGWRQTLDSRSAVSRPQDGACP